MPVWESHRTTYTYDEASNLLVYAFDSGIHGPVDERETYSPSTTQKPQAPGVGPPPTTPPETSSITLMTSMATASPNPPSNTPTIPMGTCSATSPMWGDRATPIVVKRSPTTARETDGRGPYGVSEPTRARGTPSSRSVPTRRAEIRPWSHPPRCIGLDPGRERQPNPRSPWRSRRGERPGRGSASAWSSVVTISAMSASQGGSGMASR